MKKLLDITNHERKANQNHTEIARMAIIINKRTSIVKDVEKLELLYDVSEDL